MIVGVDVSSRRIDLAWLEDGKPQRWHQELGGPKTHLIDRLRAIDIRWPRGRITERTLEGSQEFTRAEWETTEIAVEYPFGRGNAIAALMSTVGVITRQAPAWARVAWPSSGELRAAIGAKNTKLDAHRAIHDACPHTNDYCILIDWNEHELDALVACIGWTRILESQDA